MSLRTVTILDLRIQNILSVENAFRTVGADVQIAHTAADIEHADLLVLPGVGSFSVASKKLFENGIASAVRDHVRKRDRAVVGMCLGMQLLADQGEEFGRFEGLGLIPGTVRKLEEQPPHHLVPNIGWREVVYAPAAPAWFPASLSKRSFYHLHSFYFDAATPAHVAATSSFAGKNIPSIVAHGKVAATQFHPEKSQEAGLDWLHAVISHLR
jgi:imidazole glycerol-phosphate synthase subunit HisH